MSKLFFCVARHLILLLAVSAVTGSASSESQENAEPVRITSNPQGEWEPQWSPNGSMLSYGSGEHGDQNVAVIDLGTGEETLLTDGLTFVHATAWSPDGKAIAFHSRRGDSSSIWILHLEDGSLTRLTDDRGNEQYPDWPPTAGT